MMRFCEVVDGWIAGELTSAIAKCQLPGEPATSRSRPIGVIASSVPGGSFLPKAEVQARLPSPLMALPVRAHIEMQQPEHEKCSMPAGTSRDRLATD